MSAVSNDRLKDEFLQAFGLSDLPDLDVSEHRLIAVVLAFNEALRFPYFLKHHRDIGISHFIVVDNNSNDGMAEYLDEQPDVTRIFTKNSYRENKSIWRQLLCDLYLSQKWVFFPDVDELLLYPGWPELPVNGLLSYLDQNGYGGLFTTMVDMYPKGGVKELSYRPGESFVEACPYFDGSGYRFVPLKGANGRAFSVPTRHLYGGTRERLFHHNVKRSMNFLDKLLLNSVFSIYSSAPRSGIGRYFDRKLFKQVKNSLPGVDPLMSKVPLIKWVSGISFSGGVHSLSGDIKLAPDWGALLHFKYLDDFSEKVSDAIERKQHAVNSRFYMDYEPHINKVMNDGAFFEDSERFTGENSLLKHGLLRKSEALEKFLSDRGH